VVPAPGFVFPVCSPAGNLGNPLREAFVIQLEEARAEWKRRMFPNTEGIKH
jgi:hypothetical protein